MPIPTDRLAEVNDKIEQACRRAGRRRADVTLLAVTKTRTPEDIREFYDLGLRCFGENRVVEARTKWPQLPDDIEWHMIGHLQSNKAKLCLGFRWVHSVDKIETALALDKAFAGGARVNILLEANTGAESAKDGVESLDDAMRLAEGVGHLHNLKVRGLMTMAPFSSDEAVVRPCFSRLRSWRDSLALAFPHHDWSVLSMGMTNDLEWAIEEGSTLVRIGTALFEGFR